MSRTCTQPIHFHWIKKNKKVIFNYFCFPRLAIFFIVAFSVPSKLYQDIQRKFMCKFSPSYNVLFFFVLFYRLHGITRNVHYETVSTACLSDSQHLSQLKDAQSKICMTETERKQLLEAYFVSPKNLRQYLKLTNFDNHIGNQVSPNSVSCSVCQ